MVDDVFASYCAGGARFLSSFNRVNNYEQGGAIDGSITSSMDFVARSMD